MATIRYQIARGASAASLTLAALGAALTPSRAAAQESSIEPRELGPATRAGEPRFMGGLSFSVGQPRGEFRAYVDRGFGLGGHGVARLGSEGVFALRLDGGFLNYGNETIRIPLNTAPGGGRIRLDLTTSNNIFWLGAGPQLMAPRGPVRPYVNGTVGFSYFATTSSVEGRDNDGDPFAQDTNFDDATFSWGAGGGVLIPVHRSARSIVFVDVGARYHDNGRNVRYLREGGIRDLPGGGIELDVIQSRADLLTWHIGVSIGGR